MDDSLLRVPPQSQARMPTWNAWQLYALRKLAGDDEDSYKIVKKALYGAAVNFSFFLVGAIAFALYFVFSAFTRPLLWATMCGACLFPLKSMSTALVLDWLASLESVGQPLTVGVFLLPFQLAKACADLAEHILLSNWQPLTCLCAVLAGCVCCEYLPIWDTLMDVFHGMTWLATCTLDFAERRQVEALTLTVAHVLCALLWWDVPWCRQTLRLLSPIVWIVFLFFAASIVPSYRLPMFLIATSLTVVGFLVGRPDRGPGATESLQAGEDSVDGDEFTRAPKRTAGRRHLTRSASAPYVQARLPAASSASRTVREFLLTVLQRRVHFQALLWGCLTLAVYRNRYFVLGVLPLPALLLLLKVLNSHLREQRHQLLARMQQPGRRWMVSLKRRSDALVPPPLRGIARCFLIGDRKAASWLKEFIDPCMAMLLMGLLMVAVSLMAMFLAVQVRHESIHIVRTAGTLWTDVVNSYPQLQRWWGHEFSDRLVDFAGSVRNQSLKHGRTWLTSWLRHATPDNDTAVQVEAQLFDVFETVYASWGNQSAGRTSVLATGRNFSLDSAFQWLSTDNLSGVVTLVKDNLGTLQAAFESVLVVVRGNMNILLTFLTSVLSILIGSGSAVLNFLLSAVIFATSLFYLLSLSKVRYAPAKWLMSVFPPNDPGAQDGSDLISASIQGVFGATLQMITFYGVFTYFTHSLFHFQIVVIPAIVAAVIAAVPFVGTYWVAVPACLYLWLVEGSILHALLLISLHAMAFYFVDMAIYSEIKGGGHPYLTGLAVAGGVYVFGLDGAVIGPVLLCCGLVGWRVISSIFQEDVQLNVSYLRYCSDPHNSSSR